MAGAWNVASGMEAERGKGPDQNVKTWQMWQEISGSCHRNISDRQHVTRPLQDGKGFPVFPERKGFSSKKLGLEVWKNAIGNRKKRDWESKKTFLIIHSKDTYLLGKQYVSFDQTIRMFFNIHSLLVKLIVYVIQTYRLWPVNLLFGMHKPIGWEIT